jgi:hypothetical protein
MLLRLRFGERHEVIVFEQRRMSEQRRGHGDRIGSQAHDRSARCVAARSQPFGEFPSCRRLDVVEDFVNDVVEQFALAAGRRLRRLEEHVGQRAQQLVTPVGPACARKHLQIGQRHRHGRAPPITGRN